MNFLKSLLVASTLLASVAVAGDAPALPQKAKSATVVTACSQLVVVVLVSPTGEVFIVDKDTGVPPAVIKAIAQAADQSVVYDVGCPDTDPLITT